MILQSQQTHQISKLVLDKLSNEERKSSVAYLDEQVLPPGTLIKVDNEKIRAPWPAVVAFIDLEPTANWAHKCRYLLVNVETGEIYSYNAQFPPFLRGVPDTMKVIKQGV